MALEPGPPRRLHRGLHDLGFVPSRGFSRTSSGKGTFQGGLIRTHGRAQRGPLGRVRDLACGNGGPFAEWTKAGPAGASWVVGLWVGGRLGREQDWRDVQRPEGRGLLSRGCGASVGTAATRCSSHQWTEQVGSCTCDAVLGKPFLRPQRPGSPGEGAGRTPTSDFLLSLKKATWEPLPWAGPAAAPGSGSLQASVSPKHRLEAPPPRISTPDKAQCLCHSWWHRAERPLAMSKLSIDGFIDCSISFGAILLARNGAGGGVLLHPGCHPLTS